MIVNTTENGKKITFLLPGPSKRPVGGYKVVYEYANHLSDLGYIVNIIHPAIIDKKPPCLKLLKRYIIYFLRLISKSALPKWFTLNNKVRLKWVISASEKNIPDADYIFATAWQTAIWVSGYSAKKGKKFYLIQGMETWNSDERSVMETWRYPLRKIAISKWLQQHLRSIGEESAYIPNGLDFNAFACDIPVSERYPYGVTFLYHEGKHKGSDDCIEALKMLKKRIPHIEIKAFGVPSRPSYLPDWITYYHSPDPEKLREIYNRTAIFVSASHTEGWGLTSCEALQCGAALVATDIGGHREFAIDNVTALLCSPGNPQEIADNLEILMRNIDKRCTLAMKGRAFVGQFTWEKSVEKLIAEFDFVDRAEIIHE